MPVKFDKDFSFYQQLLGFYYANKKVIKRSYKDLTKKFLAYNDPDENESAFLRRPQFEALSMYIFIKEFAGNSHVYSMFDDWVNHKNIFSDAKYYTQGGQINFIDEFIKQETEPLFTRMKKYSENYPNYIYALTMGLGKTILMAACIFYEFLLAKKYPDDKLFCHNALIFAPDKTVLQSLREIMTFDKSKVVPPEYVGVLDANIKFHFLDDSGMQLHTIDNSDFNIIISNTQKILLKKRHKQESAANLLFSFKDDPLLSTVYGEIDAANIDDNYRFQKLCRLKQLGVYVDEAHHLFGSELEKNIRSGGKNKTSLRDTINILAGKTNIVACYNYTGTPYIESQLLPEVVYAYGLRESIKNGYLKDAEPLGFENVKSGEFLKGVIIEFFRRYGGKTYEGLNPKIAIYAAGVSEAVNEVRPELEKILADLNISPSKILVNVGDEKYTRNDDIRDFNNLDIPGTTGNEKQFIILVEKGKEGWNCRSLFGVALYRSPKSKIFVLQATMRCLRSITQDKLTAAIFLSHENFKILDDELHKNFNMKIDELHDKDNTPRKKYQVKFLPPERKITLKQIKHEYSLHEKIYNEPVNFGLVDSDLSKYEIIIEKGGTIGQGMTSSTKESAGHLRENIRYSELSLIGELARYLNISCVLISKILRESVDGIDLILESVNKYNQVIDDIIIPGIFNALFEIITTRKTQDKELILLREPKNTGFYEFSAIEKLVIQKNLETRFTPEQIQKSFHADTYCFDSWPEKICFEKYITSDNVSEIYYTGMFTAGQGDLSVSYYDPESDRLRQYYPDFLARMNDGTYRLIEVKAESMIDDSIVKAKTEAAQEMALESKIEYFIYSGRDIIRDNINI